MQRVRRGLRAAWEWVVATHPTITDPEGRRNARLFSGLMAVHAALVTVLMLLTSVVYGQVRHRNIWLDQDTWTVVGVVVPICVAWWILRIGRFRTAAALYVIASAATSTLSPFLPDPKTEIGVVAMTMIPVLLSTLVFSARWVAVFLAVNLVVGAAGLLLVDMPEAKTGTGAMLLMLVGVMGVLMLVLRRHHDDLADQRHARIRESEERFRDLADLLPVALYECDCNARVTFANRSAFQLFGYGPEALADGMSILQVVAPEDRGRATEDFAPVVSGRPAYGMEYTALTADGRRIPIAIYSGPIVRHGVTCGTRGIAVDLSDRKRAEEQLQRAQALLEAAVDQSPAGLVIADAPDATIRYVSRAALAIRAATDAPLIGIPMAKHAPNWGLRRHPGGELFQGEDLPLSRAILEGATVEGFEAVMRRDDGGERIISISAGPIRDRRGDITAAIAVFRDITDSRRAEDAQRLAAVGQLAAGVAHEFNNLLGAMMLGAERAALLAPQGDRWLPDLVMRCTARGAEICRDLTAFARPREPRPQTVNLEAVMDAAVGLTGRHLTHPEILVRRSYGSRGRRVHADPGQFQQVFLNLIINACHAMPEGGDLLLRIHPETAPDASEVLCASVTDTGCGIAPEALPRVFEPFFTTKGRLGESDTPGTGLGLSVSHGIVVAHGGSIQVRSAVGAGTTVEVRLPVCEIVDDDGPGELQEALSAVALAGPANRRALVAEDEADLRDLVSEGLVACGWEVVAVPDAAAAVESIASGAFDLVVTDLLMPGGGAQSVLGAMREQGLSAPVLVITGRLESHVLDELLDSGATACLHKPFTMSELMRATSALLSGAAAPPATPSQ